MISQPSRRSLLVLLLVIAIGGLAGAVIARGLTVTIRARQHLVAQAGRPDASALSLRMVDAGGVGIAADTAEWGRDYSHGTRAFEHIRLDAAPWVDTVSFADVRRDWRAYLDRMAVYGSNAVVFPAFLELIDFDGLDGVQVYDADDPLRLQRDALLPHYRTLFADAQRRGMGVFLKTDMLALSAPLRDRLRVISPTLDAGDAALWDVYAGGLDELFTEQPEVSGVVIRIGEAGALYNADEGEYFSQFAVRTPAHLRLMLERLVPVFERHDRLLVLRSWTIGIGELGDLHVDPAVYARALSSIRSPNLIISTKYTRGDFYAHVPLNETLAAGAHRRIVELQARREYEGFGAFPNWLGHEHAEALASLLAANPRIEGTYLWTQDGGPLRAGPQSLYPMHGFDLWIDANVYATARLSADPTASPDSLAAQWVRRAISDDPRIVETMTSLLRRSRDVVEQGLYIESYARQHAEVAGIELPPILWIMEWDAVGGWNAVLSTVHAAVGPHRDDAVREGFEALRGARAMEAAFDSIASFIEPELAGMIRQSLRYEVSLLTALAHYRAAFLHYYEWLESGDREARSAFREAAPRFAAAAHAHRAEFDSDLDFPAYDMSQALDFVTRAHRDTAARWTARVLVLITLLLFVSGTPLLRGAGVHPGRRLAHATWVGTTRPWRLIGADLPTPILYAVAGLVLGSCAFAATLLLAWGPVSITTGGLLVLITFAAALHAAWRGAEIPGRAAYALATIAPLLIATTALLAVIAVRGPEYFWLLFWTRATFRTIALGGAFAVLMWTFASAVAAGRGVQRGSLRRAAAASLIGLGVALIVVTVLTPDLELILAAFDDPLSILPIRTALITGIMTYTRVPHSLATFPAFIGIALLVVAATLLAADRSTRQATTPAGGSGRDS